MEKLIKIFVCLFLIATVSNACVLSKSNTILVAAPPLVVTPIYLCQNSVGNPLTAIFSVGSIHNWYGTNAVGGVASLVSPTPSTTIVGATTFYVVKLLAVSKVFVFLLL